MNYVFPFIAIDILKTAYLERDNRISLALLSIDNSAIK